MIISRPDDQAATVSAHIMRKLVDGIISESVDYTSPDSDPRDDSPFERTLCAAWDICTVKNYAMTMDIDNVRRMLIKIVTTTRRPRTRELAMGTMASLASHWDVGIGPSLLNDMDVLKLCRSILWHELDARVLLETSRLLNTFLGGSIDTSQQTIVEHDNLTAILTPDRIPAPVPSVFHQYTLIVCNTLHAELLLTSLELMTRTVVYSSAVTRSLAQPSPEQDERVVFIERADALRLVQWGTERLEEEGRGVGIGMGFNRQVAKNVMHLLWALTAYGLVNAAECGPNVTRCLGDSMERLVSCMQEEEEDQAGFGAEADDDIQNLAQALKAKLSITSN